MLGNVWLVMHTLAEDDGDHRLDQERISAGADCQVNIRYLGGLRKPRVNHHKKLVRIPGHSRQSLSCLGEIVTHQGILPDKHQHVAMLMIRCKPHPLTSQRETMRPVSTGKLLVGG